LGQKLKDPESAQGSAERWSGHATLVILLGILIEIGVILGYPHGASDWEKGSAIGADVLIGLGLLAEYVCIRVTILASALIKEESDRKLREALSRAARAEEELIRLRTPRRTIIEGKESSVTERLNAFPNVVFDAAIGPNDKEVEDFLWTLEPILWAANWQQIDWVYRPGLLGVPRGASGRPLVGKVAAFNVSVQIANPEQSPELVAAATGLVSALNEVGIDAQMHVYNILNASPSAMHVLVGPKR
jgi:hypothetical protein